LVEAFRATLEEVAEADLLLHVRDVAHPDSEAQRNDVLSVLTTMAQDGTLDEDFADRTIEVMNKADLVGGAANVALRPGAIPVSALTGEGFATLLETLDARIASGMRASRYAIPHRDGARLAWLYSHGEVTDRAETEDATEVTVRLLPADRARFERRELT
jgi:GTP-binding protein HflX